ncbi:MAG: iron-sulfur cluster assembly scaffold protein [Deltaproteobacteria bacterium]|nr:iron-sulfur cluster assembly scaffold protein [Deltaproteobacteria bacterium]
MKKTNATKINTVEFGFTDQFLCHAMTPQNLGYMSDPDGRGFPKGACGDTIELCLRIKDNRITDCVFMADGCAHTIACGSAITTLAKDKTIFEALKIEAQAVCDVLGGLPREHMHCARLAVTSLRLAIKDYLKNKDAGWKRQYRH